VHRSIAVLEAITSAPEEMKGELEPPFSERVLIPLLGHLQGLGHRLTPEDSTDRIRAKLDRAGNPHGWTVERVLGGKVLGFICALIVVLFYSMTLGLSFMPMLGASVLAALVGYFAPDLYLYHRSAERRETLQRELANAIDLLTISVEAGLGFDAACAQVAHNTEGPLGEEFARMLQEMQIGRGRAEALRGLAERIDLPDMRAFVSAMVQADAFGIPIGRVLRVQSTEIRMKKRQWAEAQAQKVPVKIMVPVVMFILPCLLLAVMGPAAINVITNFRGHI
jgi:tight adherence protein C